MTLYQHDQHLPFPKPSVPVCPIGDVMLVLRRRKQETVDIVTFEFEMENGPLRHHPGQALALRLPMPDGEVTRTFTICSAGTDLKRVSITVKAVQTGHATRWMHQSLTEGDRLTARGPFGRFGLITHPGAPLVLIGGGSGFTPMMSMLRWLAERRETVDVIALQVARTAEDLLFTQELADISLQLPNLKLYDCVTQADALQGWRGYRGRPDRAMLRAMIPDLARRTAFCCGPEGFMTQIGQIYRSEGGDPKRFLTESFGAASAPAPIRSAPKTEESGQASSFTAHLRGKEVPVAHALNLSQSLGMQGLRVPTGCGAGQCGTCKLKLLSGEVEMTQNGGLSEREVAQGFILACCSKPKSDVTLKFPG